MKETCECSHTTGQHTSDGCIAEDQITGKICPCNNKEFFQKYQSTQRKIYRDMKHKNFGIKYIQVPT